MKTSDILDIVSTRHITTKDLRRMTQQLQDAANKRVKRMMEDPIGQMSIVVSQAHKRIAKTGQSGYFTMEGIKSREQLRNRFQALQKFLGPDRKASSLTAWRKEYAAISKRLGGAPTEDFWKAYREIADLYPDGNFPGGYSSEEVQRYMMREMENYDTWEELYAAVKDTLDTDYEQIEEAEHKNEEFFTIDPNEEDLPF